VAAPRLSVNGTDASPSSGWKTVEVPYINIGGGSANWKAIHNVWIKNGGTWKLAHKTAKTNSVYSAQAAINYTTNFSYTVPSDGTRYLEVTMHGHNGAGGGGVTSVNVYDEPQYLGHRTCPYPHNWQDTATETATGGVGGTGGLANFVLEVKPGEVYKGTFYDDGSSYGLSAIHKDWNLSWNTTESVGATLTGEQGGNSVPVTFMDYPYSDTSIAVGGGQGGQGGVLTVTSICTYQTLVRGYAVSTTTGADGANGGYSATNGSRIWQTISTGSGSGSGGTAGSSGLSGDGTTGTTQAYINIIPYKSNYGTI